MTQPLLDDLDRIMAVMDCAFDPGFGEAWTRAQVEGALLMGQTSYWLINAQGQPPAEQEPAQGFALVRSILDEAELLLFAVSPDYRQRGLGKALLKRTLNDLKVAGISSVLLEMRRGNSAQYLYESFGFTPIGVRPKYYRAHNGERLDAISFSTKLSE